MIDPPLRCQYPFPSGTRNSADMTTSTQVCFLLLVAHCLGCSAETGVCTGSEQPGICGLEGQCVECLTDDDCPRPFPKSGDGCGSDADLCSCSSDDHCPFDTICLSCECRTPQICSDLGHCQDRECSEHRACTDERTCLQGRCLQACLSDEDCSGPHEICQQNECAYSVTTCPEKICAPVRCTPDAGCPGNLLPVENTLLCGR